MLLPLLQRRRSIRQFQSRPVENAKIEQLVEAMLRAPSSRGHKPWEHILVDDPELLRKLSLAKAHGSSFLDGVPLAVVLCGNPERSDVWIEDCAIAATLLQLTAESLGLGSCWVQIRLRLHRDGRTSEDYLRPILNLADNLRVLAIVGFGYSAESKSGHDRSTLEWGKVHRNCLGEAWSSPAAAK